MSSAFNIFCLIANKSAIELKNYESTCVTNDDEKNKREFEYPLQDFLDTVKAYKTQKMITFCLAIIDVLFDHFEIVVSTVCKHKRGNRYNYTTFNVLSIVSAVYKIGCSQCFLDSILKIKSATFQGTAVQYVETVSKEEFF